ncbi:hypothetical protein [Arsenicibacter rosenii]|uniref:Uncharacterized protein n=1 Tax=Arsenicibacter rosenii TaxID=1750698 RepID=A0A1S2VJU2_9BACT|nr:hypothetical protein [Arsenicibacter rosenii]OIN58485.1 hypothetical protein BLX24_12975 [Arsenicibacter rosenii]
MLENMHVPQALLMAWSDSMTRFEDYFQLICEYYARQGMCSQSAIYMIKEDYEKKLQEVENEVNTIERFTQDNMAFVNRKAIEYILIRHKEAIDEMSGRLAVCLEMLRKGEGVCHSVCLYKASQPISARKINVMT